MGTGVSSDFFLLCFLQPLYHLTCPRILLFNAFVLELEELEDHKPFYPLRRILGTFPWEVQQERF